MPTPYTLDLTATQVNNAVEFRDLGKQLLLRNMLTRMNQILHQLTTLRFMVFKILERHTLYHFK